MNKISNKLRNKFGLMLTVTISMLSSFSLLTAQISHSYDITTSVKHFQNTINSSKPTIAKFSAPWCSPCRAMEPAFEAVAKEYRAKAQFLEVDTSQPNLESLVNQYNITGLPTIVYFHQGKEILRDRKGALTKGELVSSINQLLSQVSSVNTKPARIKPAIKPKAKQIPKKIVQTKAKQAKKEIVRAKPTVKPITKPVIKVKPKSVKIAPTTKVLQAKPCI